jgi:hypothetical protein
MGKESSYRKRCVRPQLPEIAKLTDVHKDSRGRRLISKEALRNMMLQQPVLQRIVRYVEVESQLTSGRVNFTDQNVNGNLAMLSSTVGDGYWATIDFKDASDRVSMGLVRRVMPNNLLKWLELARTRYYYVPKPLGAELGMFAESIALPTTRDKVRAWKYRGINPTTFGDVKVFKYRKHAPMGSALCFPTMALVIWAGAVQRIERELTNVGFKSSDRFARASELAFVYGDDLIVPREMAEPILRDLELIGLKVNRDKSFLSAQHSNVFRESCGVDALNGVNVTPVKFRSLFPCKEDFKVDELEGWVTYANELAERGYVQTVIAIHSIIEAAVGVGLIGMLHNSTNPGAIRFTELVSKMTGWEGVVEPLPVWNEAEQKYERFFISSIAPRHKIKSDPKSNSVQLFRWLAERDHLNSPPYAPEDLFEIRGWGLEDGEFRRAICLDQCLPQLATHHTVKMRRVDLYNKEFIVADGWTESIAHGNVINISKGDYVPYLYR